MILPVVLTISILTRDAVYGNNYYYYGGGNATLHRRGPNVCAFEELLPGGGEFALYRERYLQPTDNRQLQLRTCGQNTILKYGCCEGFKSTPGRPGCAVVKSPKNVMETAGELGANEFVRYIQRSGLYDSLTTGGPYTMFVPTDEAFAKMDNTLRLALDSYESAVEILKYHVVPRRIVTQNMSADETLNTLNGDLLLRFNRKYSTKIETVNCVTVARKNRIARNGVVHLINAVLNPYAYSHRNLVQVVNQDRGLTIFSKMLEVSRAHQNLKETFQTLTVLAPTDAALQRIPQNQLRRILNDEALSKRFVLNHILPTPVCMSAVTEDYHVKSLANGGKHYVKFGCDGANSVTVQGNCIGDDGLKFLSNGMLYVVDFTLSVDEGKSSLQIMQQSGLSEFVQIVNIAGLTQTFESFNAMTVFAPTNKAVRCLNPAELRRIRSDPGAARAFVEYHVARGLLTPESVYDGTAVESLASGKRLRIQCVQNDLAVEGRALNSLTPVGYNNVVVYAVDGALRPSAVSVKDLVRHNESFSLYARAVDLLGGDSAYWTSPENCGDQHNTYFVPTDRAFQKLGAVELRRAFGSPAFLRRVLNNHRADRVLPSTLVNERGWQYELQTENEIVLVQANKGDKFTVNNAVIIETDIMTTNGLVHVVDDLILP